ncbi:autotransporter outer membrane beta-barrel domain-containing protein [Helicobacter cholecystus]|uniref:autotransporter outer membrane beta-barrel domain-containing protein n=1 Tax=Helicobacter cholecystus TaxID=45498 RepID=UPI00273918D5|nr:autotransporter outer membrane beta-barrel domain-containing protein [Helicobacter cholecystus]
MNQLKGYSIGETKTTKNITINNNATLEMYATNSLDFGYSFAYLVNKTITWQGGTIKLDFTAGGWGGVDTVRGGFAADASSTFTITSNLDFIYRESSKETFRSQGVAAIGAHSKNSKIKLLGNYIRINAIGQNSYNENKGIFALNASKGGSIYLNANDDGTLRNKDAITQIQGNISTGLKSTYTNSGSGKIYAHFSGKDSYLKGNIYANLYDNDSDNSKINISFSNGALMIGNIYRCQDKGVMNLTFDNATLKGSAKEKNQDVSASQATSSSQAATFTEGNLTFNNKALWIMTENSKINNLYLNSGGETVNINLSSAPRNINSASSAPSTLALKAIQVRGTQTLVDNSTITTKNSDDLRVLEVNKLTSNGGQVLLGVDRNKSDKIKIETLEAGTLYVSAENAEDTAFQTNDNPIVLVTAKSSSGKVRGGRIKKGLSYRVTTLEHQVSENNTSSIQAHSTETWTKVESEEDGININKKHRWVLAGVHNEVNQDLVDESGSLISNPYRMLMIESNNLNKRMGDLRDNTYNQGAWLRVFNGSDSGEGVKNLYTNIQLGYDYGIGVIGAKNYSGVAFSTSIVDISANQYNGKANTYSLGAYNAYIADNGLYVDAIAKYLYTDQKLNSSEGSRSSFGNHALSLGIEVGYRAYMGESNFYFEPQAELMGGLILGAKDINMGVINGQSINAELKTIASLSTRVGVVQGYSLKTQNGFRAEFRIGESLVNEFVSNKSPIRFYDGLIESAADMGNDVKFVLNIGTNLIFTDQWRMYIDAERSFGGVRNTDYQANIGARFSFGDKITSLPKPQKILPQKLENNQ